MSVHKRIGKKGQIILKLKKQTDHHYHISNSSFFLQTDNLHHKNLLPYRPTRIAWRWVDAKPKSVGKVGTLYRNRNRKPRISIATHATIILDKEEKRFCL